VKRGRVIFVLAIIAGSLGWVAWKGLAGNLVYFSTPTEILHKGKSAIGERIRLGGYVVPGSVQRNGDLVTFVITDNTTRMTVIDTGGVPELFRSGQGVVVEGAEGADGAFHADTVLVKHNGVYRPPTPGETPTAANVDTGG
jgi:cytochrome c-type biogenesis protein CcmE